MGMAGPAAALDTRQPRLAARRFRNFRKRTARPERLRDCWSLFLTANHLAHVDELDCAFPSPFSPSVQKVWMAAANLSAVVPHPVTVAARDNPICDMSGTIHQNAVLRAFEGMAAANAAWICHPDHLRTTVLRLVADMLWRRAMEASELLEHAPTRTG